MIQVICIGNGRSTSLRDAIETLYSVFAAYPLNAPVTGCPHCTTPEDYVRLESKPLRELTEEDLEKYAFKALSIWGGVDDFKHFLPRLFELIAFSSSRFYIGSIPSSGELENLGKERVGNR